jgi:hypothetical protein
VPSTPVIIATEADFTRVLDDAVASRKRWRRL